MSNVEHYRKLERTIDDGQAEVRLAARAPRRS
jgi:hypothetical protein